jgi:hypothetical protein
MQVQGVTSFIYLSGEMVNSRLVLQLVFCYVCKPINPIQ